MVRVNPAGFAKVVLGRTSSELVKLQIIRTFDDLDPV